MNKRASSPRVVDTHLPVTPLENGRKLDKFGWGIKNIARCPEAFSFPYPVPIHSLNSLLCLSEKIKWAEGFFPSGAPMPLQGAGLT